MIGRFIKTTSTAALIATFALVSAQPVTAAEGDAADPNTGAISVGGGVDFVTQYWFRGIAQENQEVIAQPWVELGINLYESEGVFSSVDFNVGIWNSLDSGPSGTGAGGRMWSEADFCTGLSASVSDFTVSVIYTAYYSPNTVFATTQEIALKFEYDDSGLWENLGVNFLGFSGLAPYALIAFEFDGGADGISGEGVYLELGIAPGFELAFVENYPITITFPVTLGLSLSDYYQAPNATTGLIEDDAFGYVTFGVEAGVPLAFIPSRYGEWEFHAGVYVIVLGSNVKNAANGVVTNGDSAEVFAKFGFSFSY